MKILETDDILSGAEGTATAVIDGRVVELFEVRNITATIELNKSDLKVLGSRMTKRKVTGANGTGSFTVYMVSSRWSKMVVDYLKSGKIPKFDINIKNEDPGSSIGKQVSKLSKCLIDGVDIAKIDTEADFLDQEIGFTFEDADLLEEFTEI